MGEEDRGRNRRLSTPIPSTPPNRIYLDGKHVESQIPDTPTETKRPRRLMVFDKETCHELRYNVKRLFGWMRAFRRVIIRYERLVLTYLGWVRLGFILTLLRRVSR